MFPLQEINYSKPGFPEGISKIPEETISLFLGDAFTDSRHQTRRNEPGPLNWGGAMINGRRGLCESKAVFSSQPSSPKRKGGSANMSLKTVGTALTRSLWSRGNGTPPLPRNPKASRLSTTCGAFGDHGEKSRHQSGEAPSPGEHPHKCASGDTKRPKESMRGPGVTGVRRRSFTSNAAPMDQRSYLWTRYNDLKRLVYGKNTPPPPLSPLWLWRPTSSKQVAIHVTGSSEIFIFRTFCT